MKKLLLATSALVAFAGYAAADVSFGGEATVGYNDIDEGGFFIDGELNITGTAEFDGGVSVEVTYGLDLYTGMFDAFPDVVVTTPWATLSVGDFEYAAVDMFNQLDGMSFGSTGLDNDWREVNGEVVARVDATFGGFNVGVSFDTNIANTGFNFATNALSIGVSGEFGAFRFTGAYDQAGLFDADNNDNTQMTPVYADFFGVSVGTSFGGFDVDVAYMQENYITVEDSIGVAVSTTMGGVGLAAYYAINSHDPDAYGVSASYTMGAMGIGAYWDGDDSGASNFGLDVEYTVNDEISAFAGWDQGDGFYVYGTKTLGAAEVGAGWAQYTDAGPAEIRNGVSVWLTMPF